jgi:hypothetical protein
VYVLTAFTSKDKTKGGIDTIIEIEGAPSQVAAIGAVNGGFHMDGFGPVTSENFETAIETKMKKMMEEQHRLAELQRLKDENKALKAELQESEGGFKKGIMGIGTILYDNLKDSASGREFIGMAQKVLTAVNGRPQTKLPQPVTETAAVGATEVDEDRLTAAMERLAKDNPDFIGQLEKLAGLKETDPATFEMAVDSLNATT